MTHARIPLGARLPRSATHAIEYHEQGVGWWNVPAHGLEDAELVLVEIRADHPHASLHPIDMSDAPPWEGRERPDDEDREYVLYVDRLAGRGDRE